MNSQGNNVIVKCGSIKNATDVLKYIQLGAHLVEISDALIINPVRAIHDINHDLENIMAEKGIQSIDQLHAK